MLIKSGSQLRLMPISPRYYNFVFSLLTALLMGFFMSGVITYLNTGFDADFYARWLRAFVYSFWIAFPISLFVIPLVRRILNRIFQNENH